MLDWHERYEVGVESIDHAHREIFRVINRLHKMVHMGGNTQWAAAEAVKYLRTYVVKHFEDEEAFMRSINFRDYEAHKAIHDGMRHRIVPRLYSRMENRKYSEDAIHQFLDICGKWMSRHIIGHDRELLKYLTTGEEAAEGAEG